MNYRLLAVAVSAGRLGYVFFVNDKLSDWRMSREAYLSTEAAVETCRRWISELEPEIVVTECTMSGRYKRGRTKEILRAIARVARDEPTLNVQVERPTAVPNKYAEARMLGERFPEIAPWVPRERRAWEPEPRNTIYFEALALALVVIDGK